MLVPEDAEQQRPKDEREGDSGMQPEASEETVPRERGTVTRFVHVE
jgi:hypothetical protein